MATAVCVSVSLSVPRRIPTLLHGPGCNLGNGRGGVPSSCAAPQIRSAILALYKLVCMYVCMYSAGLQSVNGFRCYDNIHICKLIALHIVNAYSVEREMSASACTRSVAGLLCLSLEYLL